ncbi:uncharacterized protein [Apostichopus japonicus]|uniref:uncharacterized protein isoform X1 n=1 Tax=Stichopus japonicus TaxID=307972 RepID=UPI003AB1E79E
MGTSKMLTLFFLVSVFGVISHGQTTTSFPSICIPPNVICDWATCRQVCSSTTSSVTPFDTCNEQLESARVSYRCNSSIGCIIWDNVKSDSKRNKCPGSSKDKPIMMNHTKLCWEDSCMELMDYCYGHGYSQCAWPPSLASTIGLNTSPSPLDSTDMISGTLDVDGVLQKRKGQYLTTEGYATTGFGNEKLKLIDSLAMAIGVAVGAFLVTLLVAIFCLCLTRRRRRKRALRSPYIEEFPMNQIPVYQAVGPALPPNHPTLRMGVGSTSMDVGTYQPILPETDRTKTTLGVSQVDDTTSTEGKNQSGHQLSQKYQKDTKRSNSLVMVKDYQTINKSYTELSSGDSTTAVQGPAYAVLEEGDTDPTHQAKTEGTDTDVVDNNYTALNVETMTDNEEAPPQDGKDVERGEVRHELNEDLVMNVPNGIATDGVESTRPKQLELETEPFRLKFTEVDTKTEYDRGSSTLRAGEQLQSEERQANDDRNVMTFPRQRGQSHHGVSPVQTGAETPSKFSFRSLRLGSKKKMKKSRKKKGSIEGELCLDVKISSPSPTEETAPSIFSAAVPLEQVEIKKMQPQEQVETETLQPPRTLQPLSKSQEALFDDAFEEPFRNRSCSQPMKQTFSPTLSKEYAEIRESWGATYVQNFKVIAESKQE